MRIAQLSLMFLLCGSLVAANTGLSVLVGKSAIVDTPVNITRVSIANDAVAEATVVTPREILVIGKAPGETTLILWQQDGTRRFYDLSIDRTSRALVTLREQLQHQLPDQAIEANLQGDTVVLSGTARDPISADRAVSIASTLGKVVNLLNVVVPPAEAQILLRIRFANLDRSATTELGANILSTGAANTIGSTSTGQFSPPTPTVNGNSAKFTFTDALNIFLFRPDLNLGATIKALQSKALLEILAEPNVMAIDGKPASFISGGEFPYPVVQGGLNAGTVTIAFREFGVKINFIPTITPRGTIRLQVTPEVSSLDFANGLEFQGFHIPALAKRRVDTEVELDNNQSFVIAGLLDNRTTENLSKIPGIGNIPVLGKLFQSRSITKSNTELLIIITPEIVTPIPAGKAAPEIKFPEPFLKGSSKRTPGTPTEEEARAVPALPVSQVLPVEMLAKPQDNGAPAPKPAPANAAGH